MANPSLAEDIKFFKTDFFSRMHVKEHYGKSFWRHFQRRVIGQRFFRDQDSAGMHAAHVRIFLEHHAVFLNQFYNGIGLMEFHGILGQQVKLVFRQTENLADFSENRAVFEFYIGAAESHILITVAVEDVF